MKKLIIALFICLMLMGSVSSINAVAETTFTGEIEVTNGEDAITVELNPADGDFFEEEKPVLSIPCDFPYFVVKKGDTEIDGELVDGCVEFTVDEYAIYTITKAERKDDPEPANAGDAAKAPALPYAIPKTGVQ